MHFNVSVRCFEWPIFLIAGHDICRFVQEASKSGMFTLSFVFVSEDMRFPFKFEYLISSMIKHIALEKLIVISINSDFD